MTVSDILEQAKTLSQTEIKELTKQLIDLLGNGGPVWEAVDEPEHWGKSLNELLDEIGPIELKYPEIEDPVEWVKHLRAEERKKRLGDWGEQE